MVIFAPEAEHEAIKKALSRHAASLDTAASAGRRSSTEDPTAQQLRRLADSRVVDATWGLEFMIGALAGMSDLGLPKVDPGI
ncbi:MAG: hypothetical protein HOW97_23330 [Catenulispora sp.]|nr:hypothetical protein [Catenulispora sp.]